MEAAAPCSLGMKLGAALFSREESGLMQEMITLISEVGFPIAVTVYLLYRIEVKLDAVVESIQTLPERMKGI